MKILLIIAIILLNALFYFTGRWILDDEPLPPIGHLVSFLIGAAVWLLIAVLIIIPILTVLGYVIISC